MDTLLNVDVATAAIKQDVLHNRWHPDTPMVSWVKPGEPGVLPGVDLAYAE